MAEWLAERRRAGDSIAQHGFQHERLRAQAGLSACARPARTRRAAEFAGLDGEETRRAVEAGWRLMKLAGVEPDGFVAPAYAYTPALRARWARASAGGPACWACTARQGSRGSSPRRGARALSARGRCSRDAPCGWTCPPRTSSSPARWGRWSGCCPHRPAPSRRHLRRTGRSAGPGREDRGFERADAPHRGVAQRGQPEEVLERAQQREVVEGFLVEGAGLDKGREQQRADLAAARGRQVDPGRGRRRRCGRGRCGRGRSGPRRRGWSRRRRCRPRRRRGRSRCGRGGAAGVSSSGSRGGVSPSGGPSCEVAAGSSGRGRRGARRAAVAAAGVAGLAPTPSGAGKRGCSAAGTGVGVLPRGGGLVGGHDQQAAVPVGGGGEDLGNHAA